MSMERQMKETTVSMEPLPENHQPKSFLQRVVSLSQSKTKQNVSSQPSNHSLSSKASLDSIEETDTAQAKFELASPVSKDEGLGESFEQSSESSENGTDRKIRSDFTEQYNGVKNTVYEPVPEENLPSKGSREDRGQDALSNGRKDSQEIALDPSKLPGYETNADIENGNNITENDIRNNAVDDDIKRGLTKSVSFLGDGNGNVDAKPVSDTFVYNEKPKSWFGKIRPNKK